MGVVFSRSTPDFEIVIKTADLKGAGTDSNVYCTLIDVTGNRSRDLSLDCKWKNDFEKGQEDTFKIYNVPNLDTVDCIELWRDNCGVASDWFVDYIKVRQNKKKNEKGEIESAWFPFPCNRWIKADRKYTLNMYDSVLPQFDKRKTERALELTEKQCCYIYNTENTGLPRQVKTCPKEESFSNDYKWDIVARKVTYLAQKKFQQIFNKEKWMKLGDLLDVYKGSFGIPYGYYNWRSDEKFGMQRLVGCNPTVIQRCDAIPEKFAVKSEMVVPFLDGFTLDEVLERKQLFIIDLEVLDGVPCKSSRTLCSPLALFYAKPDGTLLPIAIQLFQLPAEDNPVFLPSDPPYTWMLAKMYFNNADCSLHQACTHLGFTHLVCESICTAVHRTLSPSHPVFRLLAPHFLYLIAINSLAVQKLLSPDGWIDCTMTMGAVGLKEIVKRKWKNWRMNVEGWLPADIKHRGVDDRKILPSYYYRDDALMIHGAIVNYVADILGNVYDDPNKLIDDYEVQSFAAMLANQEDGAGIKGVFGGGEFKTKEDVINTVASTIFISSVQHAAANFCQYDEYAFPPNYPANMYGEVPRNKANRTEADILSHLPNKETTLSIMVVTKLLSERGTNGLGEFEVQYQYEPTAVEAVTRFKAALRDISSKIKARNTTLKQPYPYLDPTEVPNAISI